MERRGLIAVALVLAACRPDPVALDRAELERAVAEDDAISDAFADALRAEKSGKPDEAVDILKRTGEPSASRVTAAVNAVGARSAWGRKEKEALALLERDRSAELGRYEIALAGHDNAALVASLERQIAIEKRAKALFDEIHRGP